MTIPIINPFAGATDIQTFTQHLANGYEGGDDFAWPYDKPCIAAATGYAVYSIDLNAVSIILTDWRIITVRENRSVIGVYPRNVKLGDPISYGGLLREGIARDPHIDGTLNGARVPFLPWVNTTLTQVAETGTVTPVPLPSATKENTVKTYLASYNDGKTNHRAWYSPENGYLLEWTETGNTYVNTIYAAYGCTANVEMTASLYTALIASVKAVKA